MTQELPTLCDRFGRRIEYLRRSVADPSAFVVPAQGYGATDTQGRPASLVPQLE